MFGGLLLRDLGFKIYPSSKDNSLLLVPRPCMSFRENKDFGANQTGSHTNVVGRKS